MNQMKCLFVKTDIKSQVPGSWGWCAPPGISNDLKKTLQCSASTSPEIQEFSGISGIFKDRKRAFREYQNVRN